MDAGAAVFAERGYDAATMTEVAARAGASIGSLYQFFPTKPVLAEALHLHLLEGLGTALADIRPSTGSTMADVADVLFQTLLGFAEAHPAFGVLAERRDIDHERKARTGAEMRTGLAAMLSAGQPAPNPARAAEAAALLLVMMKTAVSVRAEADPGWETVVEALRVMLRARFTDAGGAAVNK